MPWTTRQPSYDVEELFPFLRGMARTTVRLHPRRQSNLPPALSKIGGTMVWPHDEPVPVCRESSSPAVPVIQLLKSDFPSLKFPTGTDLLQLLWYPRSYEDWGYNPQIEIRWRNSKCLSAGSVITPTYENYEEGFVVHECRIAPESVTEYPDIGTLSENQRQAIWNWEKKHDDPIARYQYCLSTCPGTKIGGYPDFAGEDVPMVRNSYSKELEYLLTLSDDEWDGGSFPRWRPIEQRFPPGHWVVNERPDGSVHYSIGYSSEEKRELAKWTNEDYSQYHAEQGAIGTYLKCPLNVFLDTSVNPWTCRTA